MQQRELKFYWSIYLFVFHTHIHFIYILER
jgi:hypothetical protein